MSQKISKCVIMWSRLLSPEIEVIRFFCKQTRLHDWELFWVEWRKCVSTTNGSNNGPSPIRRQAIIWTNDELGPWGQTSVKLSSKHLSFLSRKCIWKYLRHGGHCLSVCYSNASIRQWRPRWQAGRALLCFVVIWYWWVYWSWLQSLQLIWKSGTRTVESLI